MNEYEEVKGDGGLWLPATINDSLEGTVMVKRQGVYGWQLEIEQSDGTVVTTPSHKVLQNRVANVSVGDRIRIVYKGEELPKIKGHNKTKLYAVFKEKVLTEEVK